MAQQPGEISVSNWKNLPHTTTLQQKIEVAIKEGLHHFIAATAFSITDVSSLTDVSSIPSKDTLKS